MQKGAEMILNALLPARKDLLPTRNVETGKRELLTFYFSLFTSCGKTVR